MVEPTRTARPRRFVRGAPIALLLVAVPLCALWLTLPDPGPLARSNPTTTALVEQRRAEARAAGRRYQPDLRWVPLERISRRLADAVVASEDAKFWVHRGFDWEELRQALRLNLSRRRYARGGSTITQQLAKNLYLGTERSLLRKAREALLTVALERRLDKRRILALYLNLVEWGDGTFGAEAGAQRYFGVGAGALTTAQAVLMAAMLPAPRRASLAPAPPWLAARARALLDRLRDEQVIPAAEHAEALAELAGYLGAAPAAKPGELVEPPPDDAPPASGPEPRPAPLPEPEASGEPAPAPSDVPVQSPAPEPGPSDPPARAPAPGSVRSPDAP